MMSNEERKATLLAQIDFGSGTIKDYQVDCVDGFHVEYKGGFSIDIWWWENNRRCNCYLKKDDTTISCYSTGVVNERFLQLVRNCVSEMENGKYKNKKSEKEIVAELVAKRGLTSYMNNTKWREFCNAMQNEMPFQPPYIYKTLFEDAIGEYYNFSKDADYTDSYDYESFEYYNFKVIEWVKVRPRYYENKGGLLVEQKILHEAEQEFVGILNKYAIPYETEAGAYIIYGYK